MGEFIGNSTVNTSITTNRLVFGSNSTVTMFSANASGLYANNTLIANSVGPYGKTESSLNVNNAVTSGTANAIAGGQIVPSGSRVIFQQSAAPTGYTKVTANNDYAMRIVSGSVVNKTDGVSFSTAFASQSVTGTISSTTATNQATTASGTIANTIATNQATTQGGSVSSTTATNQAATQGGSVGATTLTTAQIPSHTHSSAVSDPGHAHNAAMSGPGVVRAFPASSIMGSSGGIAGYQGFITGSGTGISVSTTGGGSGGSHDHTFSGSSHNHTQDAHGHTFTGSSHNHTQDAHGHTFTGSSHNHTQDTHGHSFTGSSHNHTQDSHGHSFTGTSINLAVNYLDFILATAD